MVVLPEEIEGLTIKEACEVFCEHKKKCLAELSIFDFIIQEDKPLPFVHGIYVFFSSEKNLCLYVGRVMSPQFVERIPAHFAVSEGSWSNQFLKAHREHNDLKTLEDAAVSAKSCKILIAPMEHEVIDKMERLFILFLKPKYNKRKPNKHYYDKITPEMKITDAIKLL